MEVWTDTGLLYTRTVGSRGRLNEVKMLDECCGMDKQCIKIHIIDQAEI